ncbi:hypothetical protein QJQ45_004883 [Haematococcus lacustris]|nr:hypothetical protein QJQ45_004883 [Haematococcus lacustris]
MLQLSGDARDAAIPTRDILGAGTVTKHWQHVYDAGESFDGLCRAVQAKHRSKPRCIATTRLWEGEWWKPLTRNQSDNQQRSRKDGGPRLHGGGFALQRSGRAGVYIRSQSNRSVGNRSGTERLARLKASNDRNTSRRQVIEGPGGAVLRGRKKTKRKLMAHFQLRAEVHSQLRVIASLFVLRFFLTCLVGYPTPGQRSLGGEGQGSGQLLADQLAQWKLTKGQVKHASGLNNARLTTQRWLAPIQSHLQHLAAASSAGTSLEANLKHITVTLATWDAVWEVYLDPKWARQRLRLYGAQDRALEQFFKKLGEDMAELSMERHGRAKQLGVFFGTASIGTRAVNGKQPCEEELDHDQPTRRPGWKPPAGPVDLRLLRPAWSQQRDQPVRGLMWCPVVASRKPPQAPRSSQEATPAAASEPGPSTPPPAKRSKRTKTEPAA